MEVDLWITRIPITAQSKPSGKQHSVSSEDIPLERRRPRGEGLMFFKELERSPTKGQDLFPIVPRCGTHLNRLKGQETKFKLNLRENLLTDTAA